MEGIRRIERFPQGTVEVPGSKSLSHRGIICGALAAISGRGASTLRNVGKSEDIEATLRGVRALGVRYREEEGEIRVEEGVEEREGGAIECGESGTTIRFLMPVAAVIGGEYEFRGRGRLMERPLWTYEEVFRQAGVELEKREGVIRIRGRLRSGEYEIEGGVSSQFVSGMLLALPIAEGDSEIRIRGELESGEYVRMTEAVMEEFGVRVERRGSGEWRIKGGQRYKGAEYEIEGDNSQGAFFLSAAALGREVGCRGLREGSIQGDRRIVEVLERMGAEVYREGGIMRVRTQGVMRGVRIDSREIPDLVPVIAVLCSVAEGESRIENAGRLRYKESDRLHVMCEELRRIGAEIREGRDYLEIRGGKLKGGYAEAHGDHRVAMSLAVASIKSERAVELRGWESVGKSYPGFWKDFEGGKK